ncbi:MAG: hypothetical protein NTY48_01825, partial [Candidatus Diapherotrites archaeon]|nr:hypothetical protein [Candidatus Diapherotrites archaeon]
MAFSFFSKLIEIFKNLFKKEPVVIRTVVEDVPALVEKEFLLKRAALEDFAAKKISETKYLHSKAQGYLKIISEKELEGKSNERLNKAALTS